MQQNQTKVHSGNSFAHRQNIQEYSKIQGDALTDDYAQ